MKTNNNVKLMVANMKFKLDLLKLRLGIMKLKGYERKVAKELGNIGSIRI